MAWRFAIASRVARDGLLTPAQRDPSLHKPMSRLATMPSLFGVLLAVLLLAQAGGASVTCRDRSQCATFESCDDHSAILRAGHICNGFPYYNGGAPILKVQWDNEAEDYACLEAANGTCRSWSTHEESLDEFETGRCTCSDTENLGYCSAWTCIQDEVDKCGEHEWDCGSSVVLVDGTTVSRSCCHQVCSDGSCYSVSERRIIEKEYSDCNCVEVSPNDKYCTVWECVETDDNGPAYAEYETYTCEAASSDGSYCDAWSGDIEGREEFETSKCTCHRGGDSVCAEWHCFEKGMHYYEPKLAWIAFGLLVGGLAFGGLMASMYSSSEISWLGFIPAIVFLLGLLFVTVMLGGFVSLLVCFCIFVAIWLLLDICIVLRSKSIVRNLRFPCCRDLCACFSWLCPRRPANHTGSADPLANLPPEYHPDAKASDPPPAYTTDFSKV
eukprot:m.20145 g.20145  ORF g.20145 m.20145 type:complete len:441 (-) comp3808_c0_seq1:92-1414(-)